jgi:hypothetical protein
MPAGVNQKNRGKNYFWGTSLAPLIFAGFFG